MQDDHRVFGHLAPFTVVPFQATSVACLRFCIVISYMSEALTFSSTVDVPNIVTNDAVGTFSVRNM